MAINPKLTVNMRQTLQFLIFGLLVGISNLHAQAFKKLPGESSEQFLSRIAPENTTLSENDDIINYRWNEQSVLIAFYNNSYKFPLKNDPNQETYIRKIACVFFALDSATYTEAIIDTIDEEGDIPKIESVFFAKAAAGKDKQLIIIVSWQQVHADVSGTLYATYIYKDIYKDNKHQLVLLEKLSDKLSGGCDCGWSDGSKHTAKFKTASDVKKELKRLGYK